MLKFAVPLFALMTSLVSVHAAHAQDEGASTFPGGDQVELLKMKCMGSEEPTMTQAIFGTLNITLRHPIAFPGAMIHAMSGGMPSEPEVFIRDEQIGSLQSQLKAKMEKSNGCGVAANAYFSFQSIGETAGESVIQEFNITVGEDVGEVSDATLALLKTCHEDARILDRTDMYVDEPQAIYVNGRVKALIGRDMLLRSSIVSEALNIALVQAEKLNAPKTCADIASMTDKIFTSFAKTEMATAKQVKKAGFTLK